MNSALISKLFCKGSHRLSLELYLIPPQSVLVVARKTREIFNRKIKFYISSFHLLTTIGIGRVRMKIPQSAQRPPMSLPGKVEGDNSPYL